jgi:uncharacterized membrane protein YkvA (DUF1232 family)
MSIATLKERARALKRETWALWLALKAPGTGLPARIVIACVVAYALSPIDLIPDFIPVLGMLDDLVLVPAGIALALKLVPAETMARCRAEAAKADGPGTKAGLVAAVVVAGLWALCAWWVVSAVFFR